MRPIQNPVAISKYESSSIPLQYSPTILRNWQKCIEKVIKVETEWWEKDKLTDIEVDPLVIDVDSDDDSEDEDELFIW